MPAVMLGIGPEFQAVPLPLPYVTLRSRSWDQGHKPKNIYVS